MSINQASAGQRFRSHPLYKIALQVSNELREERRKETDTKTIAANIRKNPIRLKTVYPRDVQK